jgi:hypothetical protein
MKNLSPSIYCSTFVAFAFLLVSVTTMQGKTVDYSTMSKTELQNVIAGFGLGFDSYVIGKVLTKEQQEIAKKDGAYTAYPGTIKFKDHELFVIADETTHVVIALYKRNKKATQDDFKSTIGGLMMQYGEPTAEAHGKTIYWNYGADGLISEELYRSAKAEGMLDKLIILATVKFSSSENVDTMSVMKEKMEVDGKLKKPEEEITSDNYVMIQSDILTQKYLK